MKDEHIAYIAIEECDMTNMLCNITRLPWTTIMNVY